MANFDLVSAYRKEDAVWLRQQGYPRPKARKKNALPTSSDMLWALDADDNISFDRPHGEAELYGTDERGNGFAISGFDWNDDRAIPGDNFTVRGTLLLLSVLIRLCQRCGQLYVYPDSGDPSLVLDAALDATDVADLYAESLEQEDPWTHFFSNMYGDEHTASQNDTF